MQECTDFAGVRTVSSHNFNSHNFNLRVSNPGTILYFHINTPSGSSNLPASGRTSKTRASENRPQHTSRGNILHTRTHKSEIRLEKSTEHPLGNATENPLGNAIDNLR